MASDKNYSVGTDVNFDAEVLGSEIPVLVDFWAPWCGPCRLVGPLVEELAGEYAGKAKVVKINVDESPEVAARYGIRSIPTLAVFSGGEAVTGVVGAAGKDKIAELLDGAIAGDYSQAAAN